MHPVRRDFVERVLRSILALSILMLLAANLMAQDANRQANPPQAAETLIGHQGAAVRITLATTDNKPLDRQAVVSFHNDSQDTTNWQTTSDASQTLFEDVPLGKYHVEASAVGYVTARSRVDVATMTNPIELHLTLQPDPSVDLEDNDASMPAKTLHEIHRATRALNAGDFKEAEKRLDEAEKLSPASARVQFLFGYLSLAKGDAEQGQTYLTQALSINPGYGRALSLLGRLQLVQGQTEAAVATLRKAVAAEPENWITHDLLADAYLAQRNYPDALTQADSALAKGDGEGTTAQLARGEALANLGRAPEAIQALKTFLDAHEKSPAAPHAQEMLRKLEQQHKTKSAEVVSAALRDSAWFNPGTDLLTSPASDLPPTSWLPPSIDREKPPVAAGVSCPADQVIAEAGERVDQLVGNVDRFAAIEDITYERRDAVGNPSSSETRKFDYAVEMSQKPGVVLVDEYRTQRYDLQTQPDRIVDNGFAALALVFHPAMRGEFRMTCEGLGEWHGKATWLVRFQQRDDQPNHMQAYMLGGVKFPVDLKGRAWITADKYQIVRIESEMVKPMPQIELLAEHMVAEYGPVPFKKKGEEFWLPQTAEVYMQFRGQRYYRKHSFEKYMLFSVDTEEKVHEAKHDPDIPKSTNPKKRKIWPA